MIGNKIIDIFSLKEKVIIITGGAGLLGKEHAVSIACAGGIPVLIDVNHKQLLEVKRYLETNFDVRVGAYTVDITNEKVEDNEQWGAERGHCPRDCRAKTCQPRVQEGARVVVFPHRKPRWPFMLSSRYEYANNVDAKQKHCDHRRRCSAAFLCGNR